MRSPADSPHDLGAPAKDWRASRSHRLLFLFMMVVALPVAAVVAAAAASHLRGHSETAAAPTRGCVLTRSPYGYPDWYVTQRLQYTKHPPLPAAGWRGPLERVPFDTLFHSVFHGFVVVEYRTDLPAHAIATLRRWVRANARELVTSAPAPATAPFAVDVAKWGHELRCPGLVAPTGERLDRFLALPST